MTVASTGRMMSSAFWPGRRIGNPAVIDLSPLELPSPTYEPPTQCLRKIMPLHSAYLYKKPCI